ncbi:MAG: DNA-directed RNA polymerase subunit omega [Clostridiales Family XIII bacterium]|jgi:DNA-directed RNA polymerase subunit omega|nr:DNA-directed RNA polymerase subunit omega [Clostridiales Family XIII bacterium]
MLLHPPINVIREKADSRYTLVVMAAKRARDLIEGKPALAESESGVPISIAAEEIVKGEITYRRRTKGAAGDEPETGAQIGADLSAEQ